MPLTILPARISSQIERGALSTARNPGRSKTYVGSRLFQNFSATMPIHHFDVSHGVRTAADFQAILDLWYVVNFTPYDGFLFRDWRDYIATQANTRCTLIGGSNYQLNRLHAFGGVEFLRPIYRPGVGAVVFRTRSGTVSVATATIDNLTGVAAIVGHVSGDTYTWVGEFDIPVTFTDDEWTGSLEVHTQNLHVQFDPIKLEEIRL